MVKCSAINCESSSHKKIQGISFHRFPKDIIQRQLWLINMKLQTWKPKFNSLLCSKHFENKCFDISKLYRKLRPGAVPTIFEQVSENKELLSPPIKRVKTLLPVKGKLVVESGRKTGFTGFIISLKSALNMYDDLVVKGKLRYFPVYKISQDHREMFFGEKRGLQ